MLNGLIVSDLIDIDATELMSEIKIMYDNGFVNLMTCGDFTEMEKR